MPSPTLAVVAALLSFAAPPQTTVVSDVPPRRTITIPAPTLEVESTGAEPRRSLRSPGGTGEFDTLELTAEGLMNAFVDAVRTVNERPIPMHLTFAVVVDAAGGPGDGASSPGPSAAEAPAGSDGDAAASVTLPSSLQTSPPGSPPMARSSSSEASGPSAPPVPPSLRATIEKVDVTVSPAHDPALLASTRARLEALKGRTLTLHRRGDGSLRAIELDEDLLPPAIEGVDQVPVNSVLDRIVQALVETFPPLPAEPIGVGATWTSTVDERRTEIDRMTVTEYVVRTLDDGPALVAISRTVDVREPLQPLSDGRIPGATLSRVARLTGRGSGTLSLDAARLVPSALNVQTLLSLFIEGRTIPDGGRTIVHEQEFLAARIPHGTIGSLESEVAPATAAPESSRPRGGYSDRAPGSEK